jgi:hypothetical protein
MLPDTGGDELVLDGAQAGGTLGMMRPHLVLQAIGVRNQGVLHSFII